MHDKLIQVQEKLKAPKNQRNNFGGYNYRSCEDILEAVKPLLAEEGLLLTLNDELVQIGERYYVKATASVTDGNQTVSAIAFAREADTKKGMDDSQITGTASSYSRKYALNGLFLIDDTKDADTDEYTKNNSSRSFKRESSGNKINFKEVREKLTEISDMDELNKYWYSLKLTDKQAEVLKPDFADRKAKIGVNV